MELYLTYHKVLDKLQQFQENYCCLNSFGYGNLVDFGKNVSGQTVNYPYLFVVPASISYDQNTTTYQLSCIFADRLNESLDNEKDAVSDMSLAARQLLSEIWRGNLQDYFDAQLPVNAQPFMERFNDYVAGVALDLNITVMEDINACEQWFLTPTVTPSNTPTPNPEPTPSITPSATPTSTPQPDVTPSTTPQVTPTPSGTSSQISPSTLGALWWIDFTNNDAIYVSSSNTIDGAKNLITNLWSFSSTTNNGPHYQANSYFSVSGSGRSNVTGLSNALGVFNTSISAFTIAMNVRWESGQFGAKILQSFNEANYLGETQGYQWFRDYMPGNVGPSEMNIELNPYQEFRNTNWLVDSVWNYMVIRVGIIPSQPTQVQINLHYNDGTQYNSTARIPISSFVNRTNPIFSILYDGGFVNMTECSFFGRYLSDAEVTQLNTQYFALKYPLQ